MESPELLDTKQLVELLQTDEKVGLTLDQAVELEKKYGPNELKGEEPTPLWKLVRKNPAKRHTNPTH